MDLALKTLRKELVLDCHNTNCNKYYVCLVLLKPYGISVVVVNSKDISNKLQQQFGVHEFHLLFLIHLKIMLWDYVIVLFRVLKYGCLFYKSRYQSVTYQYLLLLSYHNYYRNQKYFTHKTSTLLINRMS